MGPLDGDVGRKRNGIGVMSEQEMSLRPKSRGLGGTMIFVTRKGRRDACNEGWKRLHGEGPKGRRWRLGNIRGGGWEAPWGGGDRVKGFSDVFPGME